MTRRLMHVDGQRLVDNIMQLGQVGRDGDGRLVRLAASDEDRAGRDLVVQWFEEAGLDVVIDRIGNIFGIWRERADDPQADPLMIGSHIDTVIDAGIYDGSYGVLAGLEVVRTLQEVGFTPKRPIVVVAFTNEEGVRYAPDMMGSLVYVGDLPVDRALATVGIDGTTLGEELERIGYAGRKEVGFLRPFSYIELHIEQGPVLDTSLESIGVVESLQGISWQEITVEGAANHAGTTPMNMRRDAGLVVAKVQLFLDEYVRKKGSSVATVGRVVYEPNAINVIPGKVMFSVDLRDPDEAVLEDVELALERYLEKLADEMGVVIDSKQLARFSPVEFSKEIVHRVEEAAKKRGLSWRRMTSGAGHDAQMMARICPTGMIFVPSRDGVSHHPDEFTTDKDLIAGANVLLDVVKALV